MTCEQLIERLVDGARPGDDPQLAAHLGSCLRCYRAAADLRDLPAIQDLLRASQEEENQLSSPGEAFFRSFPAAVAAAAARATTGEAEVAVRAEATSPSRATPGWLAGVLAFWRRPMPAAFAGAACAAAMAFVVVRPLRLAPPSTPAAPAAVPFTSTLAGQADPAEEVVPAEDALDESVGGLDEASLGAVLDSLSSSLAGELPAASTETEVVSDLATTAEELEELDEQGLQALSEDLGKSI